MLQKLGISFVVQKERNKVSDREKRERERERERKEREKDRKCPSCPDPLTKGFHDLLTLAFLDMTLTPHLRVSMTPLNLFLTLYLGPSMTLFDP